MIPPSLSVENQDAGVNSPPAILAVRSDLEELPEPGPVIFERNPSTPVTLNATLLDTDLEDTLYLRVFVDYTVTDPKPPRATCKSTSSDSSQRSVTCDITALCQMQDVGNERFMTVQVFDREVQDSGTPAFKAMLPGGLTTSKFYVLKCQDPS